MMGRFSVLYGRLSPDARLYVYSGKRPLLKKYDKRTKQGNTA